MREKWTKKMRPAVVAEACQKRIDHHNKRLEYWDKRRDELEQILRSQGLKIEETGVSQGYGTEYLIASSSGSAYSDYSASTPAPKGIKVVLDPQMQKDVQEASNKVANHVNSIRDYTKWLNFLKHEHGNFGAEEIVELDHADFVCFFMD